MKNKRLTLKEAFDEASKLRQIKGGKFNKEEQKYCIARHMENAEDVD